MLHTILGSSGNIGMQLAKDLSKYTDNIRLVSRNPKPIHGEESLLKADLLVGSQVDAAVEGSDTVYLVAGITYKTRLWQEQWPLIMENTIQACQRYGAKLVFFDNMYCYDPGHVGHLTEETPVNPQSNKGKVRAEIAQMIMDEVESGTLKAMIVRAADFYGPDAKLSMLNESVINRMKAGKTAQWLYSKERKHSFTYIPDAAFATAFLAQQEEAWNQVWHLPTSDRYPTAQECVDILAKELGVPPKLQVLPGFMVSILAVFIPLLKEIKELRYQLDQDYCFDSGKIEKAYGLKATDLEKGLKSCV
ncbi:NAD-dependent epimerase/dehydratase family protein [Cyclobacterium plantarum]|uniref:NAD-dependent epimerase/dehydratase family protein n=1 Tax=Cyclobacterium plantarum TaxID=2716263 RepID=A0ABX0H5Q7_9BACT|nr:NAD-dependent epimerase/dehydratase family protein [Cyclobacterium plantarum]NHE56770.1 NAD-dependent epimerase/dehydratase family protein [Cyclobacterium plantarum]